MLPTRRLKAWNMAVCYLGSPVESNTYAVDFKGGQSFGEPQGAALGVIIAIIITHHMSSMMIQYAGAHPAGWNTIPAMRWGNNQARVILLADIPVPPPFRI